MPKLGVNIDHVATLREVRKAREPDPVAVAELCERAGADGITAHLREDRRHIQENDVRLLRRKIATRLNLEMAATEGMIRFAVDLRPDMATLVPERREELTTEGGLDVAGSLGKITAAVSTLTGHGTEVSLFIEPDIAQIRAALGSGARFVELHTGAFANAHESGDEGAWKNELARLKDMTRFARESGLTVNMGHGLNYRNTRLVAEIEGVHEFNIGHAIVARAIMVGFERAVREMLELTR
jgi:pyridoxine 5-phosphate synthase